MSMTAKFKGNLAGT